LAPGFPAFITKEKLLPLLRPSEQVTAPKLPPSPPTPRPPLKDETNGKSFIECRLYAHMNDGTVDSQLKTAIRVIWYKGKPELVYMEDIAQKRFLKQTKSKWNWDEFVKVMKGLGHSPELVDSPPATWK
jgi:hypothetical protein